MKVKYFHLVAIMSVSRSHEILYFPIYLIGSVAVANIGMVFVLAMQRPEENMFLGLVKLISLTTTHTE